VLSGNDENMILDTVIVVPISSKTLKNMLPYRFDLGKIEGLKHQSSVLVNQVRAISKQRIDKKIASIDTQTYNKIVENLCLNFTG
jgi:mRNA interferase MazF